jgi:glycine cleavage system H protein
MAQFKYTKDHECIYVDGDTAWIGISQHAQDALGDLVFVELPEIGKALKKGQSAAVVESVKTAAEVYTPVDGTITAVNTKMPDDLELIKSPVNDNGWIVKVKIADASAVSALMDELAYKEYLKGL